MNTKLRWACVALFALCLSALAVPAAAQVFTGRTAMLIGREPITFRKTLFTPGMPLPVSDAVAEELEARADFLVTEPTYHAKGPGCC